MIVIFAGKPLDSTTTVCNHARTDHSLLPRVKAWIDRTEAAKKQKQDQARQKDEKLASVSLNWITSILLILSFLRFISSCFAGTETKPS